MNQENTNINETYLNVLRESLERKLLNIKQLLILTEKQEQLIVQERFEEEEFLKVMDEKADLIENLNQLDAGFDQIYKNISDKLALYKEYYKEEILTLQELIKKVTDESVMLQALEKRNRNQLEVIFQRKRKEIKNLRTSNKSVSNYYNAMTKQQEQQSFFYDKKK